MIIQLPKSRSHLISNKIILKYKSNIHDIMFSHLDNLSRTTRNTDEREASVETK
jgi:hypothetical protein